MTLQDAIDLIKSQSGNKIGVAIVNNRLQLTDLSIG